MIKHLSRLVGMALGAVALAALSGCTDSTSSEVKGQVTFDGQPIEKGVISFYPDDGTKGNPGGGPIVDGKYAVTAPVGMTTVRISMPKEAGKKKLYNTPNSPTQSIYKEALPDKYNLKSELKLQVVPGGVTKDWELTSK